MFGHAKATDDIWIYIFMTSGHRKGLPRLRKDGIEISQTSQKQEIKNIIRARFENE